MWLIQYNAQFIVYYYINSQKCHWNNFKVCVTSWVPMTQISHQNLYTSPTCRRQTSGVPYVATCATTTQPIIAGTAYLWRELRKQQRLCVYSLCTRIPCFAHAFHLMLEVSNIERRWLKESTIGLMTVASVSQNLDKAKYYLYIQQIWCLTSLAWDL